jgi:hypothetical protein
VEQDVGGVLPQLGGVLNFGKPPVPGLSTPMFWAPHSGDQLKNATPVHNLAKKGGKSLPCHDNVAVA